MFQMVTAASACRVPVRTKAVVDLARPVSRAVAPRHTCISSCHMEWNLKWARR